MHCPACQHENRATARFCEHCGTPLPRICPVCNAPASNVAKFCSDCGQPLISENRTPLLDVKKLVPEGERKHVTVLFADVVGSTEIVEAAGDPVVELLRAWFGFRDEDDRPAFQSRVEATVMGLDPSSTRFARLFKPCLTYQGRGANDPLGRGLWPETFTLNYGA